MEWDVTPRDFLAELAGPSSRRCDASSSDKGILKALNSNMEMGMGGLSISLD